MIGPWIHKYPHFAVPNPAIGFLQEAKRWWDHWLKGIDNGVMDDAACTFYLQDILPPKGSRSLASAGRVTTPRCSRKKAGP
ncbi:hypothetical protein, partial [Klebsiella pneumoniae]|uniref:hypothetical protein n=1 Tax=Klebsiella pneumoniae TaxID=573 RepID=UPI00272F2A5E